MAKCWKCGKRCRADISCLWCRRGPMCLKCSCDCRLWPDVPEDKQNVPTRRQITVTKRNL